MIFKSFSLMVKNKIKAFKKSNSFLKKESTALIIIDIQEKLLKVIPDNKDYLFKIKKIVDAAEILEIDIYITEQNPLKLGKTEPYILPSKDCNKFSKLTFSCISCKELIKRLNKKKTQDIIIVGIESHICVLQSSLDLLKAGFNVHIMADAIKSRHRIDHELALARLNNEGCLISTIETAIFELCKTSENKKFKDISQIIKRKN